MQLEQEFGEDSLFLDSSILMLLEEPLILASNSISQQMEMNLMVQLNIALNYLIVQLMVKSSSNVKYHLLLLCLQFHMSSMCSHLSHLLLPQEYVDSLKKLQYILIRLYLLILIS